MDSKTKRVKIETFVYIKNMTFTKRQLITLGVDAPITLSPLDGGERQDDGRSNG